MRFLPKSLSRKVVFAYLSASIFIFVATGLYLAGALQQQFLDRVKSSLEDQTRSLSYLFTPIYILRTDQAEVQAQAIQIAKELHARITLIDAQGNVRADSDTKFEDLKGLDNHGLRPEVKAALQGHPGRSIRFSTTVNQNLMYYALPLYENDQVAAVLRVALSIHSINRMLAVIRATVVIGTVAGIVLILIISIFINRYMMRRISYLTRIAQRYAVGDLNRKILMGGDDELKLLGDAMNHMSSSLQQRMIQLESERTKLKAVLDNMAEGLIAVDSANEVMMLNASAEKKLHIASRDAIGKNLIQIIPDREVDEMVIEALNKQKPVTREIELYHPVKKILRVSAAGIPAAGKDVSAIIVFYDVTEVRKLESMRRDFVANVSHELRTPLTSIKGFIETLLSGAMRDPKTSETFLKMIEEDTSRLTRLIDELLELSRLESQDIQMHFESLNLKTEIVKILETMKPQFEKKKIRVQIGLPDDLPKVKADKDKLRQILLNLLDNAVKFNKENGLVSITAVSAPSANLTVSIEDSGIGISSQDIPRVFERFYRAEKSRAREVGGTGLGLAIVKHLVEGYGGQVSCQSVIGKGSVFSFTLPLSV